MAEVTNIEELEDGGAIITIDLDERELQLLLSSSIETAIMNYIEAYVDESE